jgi:hypothetical protein
MTRERWHHFRQPMFDRRQRKPAGALVTLSVALQQH